MEENEKKRNRRATTGIVVVGVLVVLALVVGLRIRNGNSQVNQGVTSQPVAAPVAIQASATTPQPPETTQDATSTTPTETTCTMFMQDAGKTAETRRQFAEKVNESEGAMQTSGVDPGLETTTGGDDAEDLLFTTPPANGTSLADAVLTWHSDKGNAILCNEGFAEVQFIVKREDGKQTLMKKFKTDGIAALNYARKYQVTPMQ